MSYRNVDTLIFKALSFYFFIIFFEENVLLVCVIFEKC